MRIATVDQYGDLLVIRDSSGTQIGQALLNGGEYVGHSAAFILLRYGDRISTIDYRQFELGSTVIPSDYRIGNINESGFTARSGSLVQKFDQRCCNIGSYSV